MLTETIGTGLLAGVGITPDCPRIGQAFLGAMRYLTTPHSPHLRATAQRSLPFVGTSAGHGSPGRGAAAPLSRRGRHRNVQSGSNPVAAPDHPKEHHFRMVHQAETPAQMSVRGFEESYAGVALPPVASGMVRIADGVRVLNSPRTCFLRRAGCAAGGVLAGRRGPSTPHVQSD